MVPSGCQCFRLSSLYRGQSHRRTATVLDVNCDEKVNIKAGNKFKYGVRFFSETGSNNISVVDLDASSKFGLLIDFGLPKCLTSPYPTPEIILRSRGHHLGKRI